MPAPTLTISFFMGSRLFESKRAAPVMYSEVFHGLESIPRGLQAIESRKSWGKIAVRLREDDAVAKL